MQIFSSFRTSLLPIVSKTFVAGDAVNGTVSLIQRLATAGQIIGFGLGSLMLIGCFLLMQVLGERKRQAVKDHLVWVIFGIIGLFAAGAIATFFKAYSQGSF